MMRLFEVIGEWLGVLSPAHIVWFNAFHAKTLVGTDQDGNRYFEGKPRKGYYRPRRWVVYEGEAEASRVPPEWHAWLHFQSDVVPDEAQGQYRKAWQKPHTQNLTGTNQAYRPPGHILKGGARDTASGDYEAWSPAAQSQSK